MRLCSFVAVSLLVAGCVATKEPPPALEAKANVAPSPAATSFADDASPPPPPPSLQDAREAGPPDPCAAMPKGNDKDCTAYTFVGELTSTKDDREAGYAHALRWYQFRRLQAWGPAPSEISAAVFVPNKGEPSAIPRLVVHQRYLVVLEMGGHSNCMPMIASAAPFASAAKAISALGPACDSTSLPE